VCFSAWQEILNEKTKPVLHEASPAEFEEIAKETRDNQIAEGMMCLLRSYCSSVTEYFSRVFNEGCGMLWPYTVDHLRSKCRKTLSVTWNGVKMCSQRGQAAKTGNADLVSLDLKIARRVPRNM